MTFLDWIYQSPVTMLWIANSTAHYRYHSIIHFEMPTSFIYCAGVFPLKLRVVVLMLRFSSCKLYNLSYIIVVVLSWGERVGWRKLFSKKWKEKWLYLSQQIKIGLLSPLFHLTCKYFNDEPVNVCSKTPTQKCPSPPITRGSSKKICKTLETWIFMWL